MVNQIRISFVDAQLGKVVDALEKSPYKDNTYIVMYSDHGFHLGEKERWAKRSLWSESTRVPMIIVGPGIKPGVCHKPVQLLDIYPTLLELTGHKKDPKHEGNSLVPLLKNPKAEWPHMARTSFGLGNYSIVSEHYRYIHYNGAMATLTVQLEDGTTEEIEATANHPFWVENPEILKERSFVHEIEDHERNYSTGAWINAHDLRIGARFKLFSGKRGVFIANKLQRKQLKVFNFTVENNHNYLVGEPKVLVHNTFKCGDIGDLKYDSRIKNNVKYRRANGQFASQKEVNAAYNKEKGLTGGARTPPSTIANRTHKPMTPPSVAPKTPKSSPTASPTPTATSTPPVSPPKTLYEKVVYSPSARFIGGFIEGFGKGYGKAPVTSGGAGKAGQRGHWIGEALGRFMGLQ